MPLRIVYAAIIVALKYVAIKVKISKAHQPHTPIARLFNPSFSCSS
jgi:hypothetical protein